MHADIHGPVCPPDFLPRADVRYGGADHVEDKHVAVAEVRLIDQVPAGQEL